MAAVTHCLSVLVRHIASMSWPFQIQYHKYESYDGVSQWVILWRDAPRSVAVANTNVIQSSRLPCDVTDYSSYMQVQLLETREAPCFFFTERGTTGDWVHQRVHEDIREGNTW